MKEVDNEIYYSFDYYQSCIFVKIDFISNEPFFVDLLYNPGRIYIESSMMKYTKEKTYDNYIFWEENEEYLNTKSNNNNNNNNTKSLKRWIENPKFDSEESNNIISFYFILFFSLILFYFSSQN